MFKVILVFVLLCLFSKSAKVENGLVALSMIAESLAQDGKWSKMILKLER